MESARHNFSSVKGCISASITSHGKAYMTYQQRMIHQLPVSTSCSSWIEGKEGYEFAVSLLDNRAYHWTATYASLEVNGEQVCSVLLDRNGPPLCHPVGDCRRECCFFGYEETDDGSYAIPFRFAKIEGHPTNSGIIRLELHHVKPHEGGSQVGPAPTDSAGMGVLGCHILGGKEPAVTPGQLGARFVYLNRRRIPFLTFEWHYRSDVARLAREHRLPSLHTGPAPPLPSLPPKQIESITLSDSEDEAPPPQALKTTAAKDFHKTSENKKRTRNLTPVSLSSDEDEIELGGVRPSEKRRVAEPTPEVQ